MDDAARMGPRMTGDAKLLADRAAREAMIASGTVFPQTLTEWEREILSMIERMLGSPHDSFEAAVAPLVTVLRQRYEFRHGECDWNGRRVRIEPEGMVSFSRHGKPDDFDYHSGDPKGAFSVQPGVGPALCPVRRVQPLSGEVILLHTTQGAFALIDDHRGLRVESVTA
jgi:hypothetical protein